MTKPPPPLLGHNNNVRYMGRTFHIQTEDSGTKYARIVTHLFVDGGRIVKSTKTQYNEVLSLPDRAETIRRMMKEQHKAMFFALRAGEYNDAIARILGHSVEPAVEASRASNVPSIDPQSVRSDALASAVFSEEEPPTVPTLQPRTAQLGEPPAHQNCVPQAKEVAPAAEARASRAIESRTGDSAPSSQSGRSKSSGPPPSRRHRVVDDPTPVELPPVAPNYSTRPSERPRVPLSRPLAGQPEIIDPRNQSIFGESGDGRQTLDEVILSFLEEEDG